MQSSSETQRKRLQEDVIRTKGALSDLEREKLLTGMLLKECKDKLSYSQDILDGHYKFTFLIQGDPQTGKTTFLNVLFDDAIIPPSGYNAIIVVQYDETLAIPALFTAPLNDIFNSERQVFVINPEILRDTGIRESAKIYSTLKEATKTVNPRLGQTVYVIKHRIPWLKKLIGDEFILNRIQFVEINMPPENDPNPENLLRLEKIISSTDHANIFVADGTKLFSIDTAAKYKELSNNKENKEKSLLIINRTDQLGTKEHIQKIRQNEPRLCLKLQKEIQTIMKIIKDAGDTEEMRCEIFLQSFYEDQRIDQDKLTDGDVIYFVSALFAFNKILLSRYEKCEYDGEKFALCSLFNERNEDNPVYQSNKIEADLQELDILQYHIKEEPDLYESNFEPIKNAISKIAKTKFAALEDILIKKVEETRLKISDCRSYLTDDLSEQIEDLKTLGGEIKTMIEERSTAFQELINNFKEKIIVLFEEFHKGIRDINTDFYVVKAHHANDLTSKTKQFEEKSKQTTDKFKQDYTDMETRYKQKIDDLDNANKDKKSLNYYIANNVRSEFRALEKRSGSLVNLVEGFAICTTNRIIRFVNDGKGFNILTNLLRILAQLFGHENTFDSFEETVEKSKSIFKTNTRNLMDSHCVKEKKKKKKFEEHFTDYLSNTTSGNIERAQKIIQEHFKSLKI